MTVCRTRRYPKRKICAGDLRHKIRILRRQLGTPGPGQQDAPLTFTLVKPKNAGIEVVSPSRKFEGVNTEDRPTHIFTVRREVLLIDIEYNNHFIQFNNRYFKIQRVAVVDEDPRYMDYQVTERGDITKQAAEG